MNNARPWVLSLVASLDERFDRLTEMVFSTRAAGTVVHAGDRSLVLFLRHNGDSSECGTYCGGNGVGGWGGR